MVGIAYGGFNGCLNVISFLLGGGGGSLKTFIVILCWTWKVKKNGE